MATILVIDDNLEILDTMIAILEMERFEAIGAANGATGLQLARERQPDLIICDIRMPGMDGFAVRDQLLEDPATKSIPFIFLTAHADDLSVKQGLAQGATDYVTKPFLPDNFLAKVRGYF